MSDMYMIRGHDNELWGYDIVCVGTLSTCIQFVENSPYCFDDIVFDRIQVAKHNLWRILEEFEDDNYTTAGFMRRLQVDTDDWYKALDFLATISTN